MPRKFKPKTNPEIFNRRDKYKKALARLRVLQEQAELPENRYFCRCHSAGDIDGIGGAGSRKENLNAKFTGLFKPIAADVFPNGSAVPRPIDPSTVTGIEIIFRTLINHVQTCPSRDITPVKDAGLPDHPQDGYVRWEPGSEPKTVDAYKARSAQIAREMARLQSRKDKGYENFAAICESCPRLTENPDSDNLVCNAKEYVQKFRETITAYEKGEIDWPKHVPELFRIKPRAQELINTDGMG